MPEYIIKTDNGRNLVIEADRYNYNATEGNYEFFKKDDKADLQKVATVTNRAFLAIVEKNAEKADFYDRYDLNEGNNTNECLLEQFVKSDTFFDEVWNIIDFYLSPDNQDEDPSVTIPDVPVEQYPIEHWRDKYGSEWWGFWNHKGFVHSSTRDSAEENREREKNNPGGELWSYLNLTGATRLEED